jgi:CheY-like chemotaxis protein
MARLPTITQTEQTIRPVSFIVRKLLVTGRCCPNCGSPEIRPSNRRNALDVLLACVFLAPFRCRICRDRFYRVWRPSLQRPPDPPIAPLQLVPVDNKLLNIDSIEPRRHAPEPIHPRSGEPPAVQIPQSEIEPTGLEVPEPEPVESAPATGPELRSSEEPRPASAQGPILIVEDDLSIRKLLRRQLDRRGYLTVEVSHSDDLAVELLGRSASLLIVDVSATRTTGVEAVVALALAHPRLKILALSAESLQGSEIPGRLVALPKPFPLDSFLDCVERLLAEPHA